MHPVLRVGGLYVCFQKLGHLIWFCDLTPRIDGAGNAVESQRETVTPVLFVGDNTQETEVWSE